MVYVTVLGRDFTTVEDDLMLLRAYHSKLQQQLVTHQALVEGSTDYSWEQFYEEYCTALLDMMAQHMITFTAFIKVCAIPLFVPHANCIEREF